MLFLFWIFLVAFTLIQQLCSSSLSFSLVAALNGICLNLSTVSPTNPFLPFYPSASHRVSDFYLTVDKGNTYSVLVYIGMDIHAGANTHSRPLSVVKIIASDCAVGKNAIFPGLSHAEHFPEPGSAGRCWRRCLGNNNHTHPDAVGKGKMFLEYWNIFRRSSWISALREFLKTALVPSSWTCKLSFDEYLNSEIK